MAAFSPGRGVRFLHGAGPHSTGEHCQHLSQAVENNGVPLPNTISNIMDRWTLQMGFPLVTVNTLNGSIRQSHFLLDSNSTVERPSVFE